MKVIVRVRPANERESNSRNVVQVLDNQSLLFDPKEEIDEFYYQGSRQNFRDLCKKPNKELRLNFNNVFDENSTNEEIYNCTTAEIIEDLVDGYNCAVFAYGPTGAGKTFTMLGNAAAPGITFMTMMGLYDLIKTRDEKLYEVAVTYIEIYNENLRDLLSVSNNLQIREDPRRGVMVAGISIHKPKTAVDLLNMLQMGNQRRSQHSTDANAESSRSHAVFTVFVTKTDRGAKTGSDTRGKMSFVDLAGSERATAISKNKIPRLREGANINKSLLALGNCINALADGDTKNHVPYRDSKLTRLLKDSLGGNCKTIMIAAISPSQLSYEDTYNTLKYADRAQSIKVNAKQNIRTSDKSVSHYIKLVKELQLEIEQLKAQLAVRESPVAPVVPMVVEVERPVIIKTDKESLSVNIELRANFENVCSEKRRLLQHYSKIKRQLRDFEFRVCRKEWRRTFLKCIKVDSQAVPDSTILNLHHRFNVLQAKKDVISQQIAELNAQRDSMLNDSNITEEDRIWMNSKMSEIQMENFKQQNYYLARTVEEVDQNICINSRLLHEILPLFKRQYNLLTAYGKATSDVVEDYEKVANMIRDYKDVSWADQRADEPPMNIDCDFFESYDRKLMSLADLEWKSTKSDLVINAVGKSPNCMRSLNYSSDVGVTASDTDSPESDDVANSTFTKEDDSPFLPDPTISVKPAAPKLRSPPAKYPFFKLSSILNTQRGCQLTDESTKSPSLKRSAPLSTCTNKIDANSEGNNAKRRRLFAVANSPQGAQPFRLDAMKMKLARRAHQPQRIPKINKEVQENNPINMDPSHIVPPLPKQTITSMLRTKKVAAIDRPRLFST